MLFGVVYVVEEVSSSPLVLLSFGSRKLEIKAIYFVVLHVQLYIFLGELRAEKKL